MLPGYDEESLDKIATALKGQGIDAEYGDYMDVSENKDKDDYGRSISGKDKRTFIDPKDLTPAARAKKLASLKEKVSELGYLSENISMFDDYISGLFNSDVEEKEGFQSGIWEKEEYGDPKAYEEADKFISLMSYLDSIGGKATLEGNPDINLELLPGGDIQWSANVTMR